MINKIHNEDCLHTMAKMKDGAVDMILTSPPYDDMRQYDTATANEFNFDKVAPELYRVLKTGGALVWVVGDQTIDGNESATSFRQALAFKDIGFRLFDTMIYMKPPRGIMGGSKGYWQNFEYMFVFSKGSLETINLIEDRKNVYLRADAGTLRNRQSDGSYKERVVQASKEYGRRGNIWYYSVGGGNSSSDDITRGHTAIFPEMLAHDHILSWSDEGHVVYDPFMGAGTTALIARQLGRRYIGSEISQQYHALSLKRLESAVDLFTSGDGDDADA